MSETIDDLTVEYIDNGVTTVKELDKQVLSKGAWSTIIFKYQNWDASKEAYGPVAFTIRRYQKRQGVYSQRSKFNISSVEQAKKIMAALTHWIDEEQSSPD